MSKIKNIFVAIDEVTDEFDWEFHETNPLGTFLELDFAVRHITEEIEKKGFYPSCTIYGDNLAQIEYREEDANCGIHRITISKQLLIRETKKKDASCIFLFCKITTIQSDSQILAYFLLTSLL